MKVTALRTLHGGFGRKAPGDTFVISDEKQRAALLKKGVIKLAKSDKPKKPAAKKDKKG